MVATCLVPLLSLWRVLPLVQPYRALRSQIVFLSFQGSSVNVLYPCPVALFLFLFFVYPLCFEEITFTVFFISCLPPHYCGLPIYHLILAHFPPITLVEVNKGFGINRVSFFF